VKHPHEHTVMVILSCLHTRSYPMPAPVAGERVYCVQCGGYKDVAEAPHNYVVRCRDCLYGKVAGNARITAETSAVRHSLRRPGHHVALYDGQKAVGEYHHDPLPADADIPPF
jgi:hypothetical protein